MRNNTTVEQKLINSITRALRQLEREELRQRIKRGLEANKLAKNM